MQTEVTISHDIIESDWKKNTYHILLVEKYVCTILEYVYSYILFNPLVPFLVICTTHTKAPVYKNMGAII